MRDGALFSDGQLNVYLEGRLRAALDWVDRAPEEEVRFSPEALTDLVVSEFGVEPVNLDFEHISRTEPREVSWREQQFDETFDVRGQTMSIVVPMTGDAELLRRRATTYTMGPAPKANIRDDAVVFSITERTLTKETVHSAVKRFQEQVSKMLEWTHADVREWQPRLRASVAAAANDRKRRLDDAAALSAALDIPLISTAPSRQFSIPVTRKTVRLDDRRPASADRSEPRLTEAIYEDVVRTVSALARGMERLPITAARFNEEELRDLILFVLNSNYEGAARGEVFNGAGKTDILLTWNDRNAFIGECKFWGGQARFREAIDQLVSYLVWRDTKAALLLFIRGGQPSDVIAKADAAIRGHRSFKSATPPNEPDVRRDYLMTADDDEARSIRVALLPVVIPAPLDGT